MLLSSFSYNGYGWSLKEMGNIGQANLLVGKNASGKTRTLKALQRVVSILLMKPVEGDDRLVGATLTFRNSDDESWTMTYSFEMVKARVEKEELTVCGRTLIERDRMKAELKGETVTPPNDRLLVLVRRDREAYPEIETLMEWAEGVTVVSCSDLNSGTSLRGLSNYVGPMPFGDLVKALSDDAKKIVMTEARKLGYRVSSLNTIHANSELNLVAVKEENVPEMLVDFQLSNGMLRVLYILCFLEYVKTRAGQRTLLIDDLGEGLDYNRATLLGRKVFEICEQEGVQLIASSNDSFMMDVVDISMWQIVRREDKTLKVMNQTTEPELFKRFRMTGLSNFDLFSSDFIDNFLARGKE